MEEGDTIKIKVKKEKIKDKKEEKRDDKEKPISKPKKKTTRKQPKLKVVTDDEPPISLDDVIQKLKSLREGDEYKVFLSKLELLNRQSLEEIKSKTKIADFAGLYPHIDDPLFNLKIAQKKEFHDLKSDDKVYPIEERGKELCEQIDFELLPHQHFVRNFLSFHTPYNSLLLFHGLGTGKTCSGISVCEEMRDYMKQMGINKRIIIIAPPNILDNFRLQLFDERKLKLINGYWNLNACTGNKFIKEINPMNMRGLSKQQIVKQIKNIINSYYAFFGPDKFANYVERILAQFKDTTDPDVKARREIAALKREFSNRLILIDEVHNIRSEDSESKKVSKYLFPVIKNADNLKLLLLSATPMFNSYDEIIWLVNLMNINDGRPEITISDVFDKSGEFKTDDEGKEVGKELLIRKATGYISYLRGENPYSFPFRIYMKNADVSEKQPGTQMNDAEIADESQLKHLELCMTHLADYQTAAYKYIIEELRKNKPEHFNSEVGGMGYSILSNPIQALNMTYPADLEDEPENLVGKRGMTATMKFDKETRRKFAYRDAVLEKYGRIFSHKEVGKYSAKIKFILDKILKSEGVVLIYSQYIEGGCVPLALALEEAGITRYGDDNNNNLFSKAPTKSIDAISLKDTAVQNPAKYVMITGDGNFSPNNVAEVKAATNADNVNGEKVKVIIISSAGSEGIDFKFVRQVHILDPWFNINRIEQIIGRGVRFCSHKDLPIEKRNVEIYLHASAFDDGDVETADRYVYRLAEQKAIKIGNVTRVLKETAVDCNLNKTVYTEEKMNQTLRIKTSTGEQQYNVGDKSFSTMCDYMADCEYKCKPEANVKDEDANMDTYSESFIQHNNDILINKIKAIYKDGYIFTKAYIISVLNKYKPYPEHQLYSALDRMVNDKSVYIYDQFDRRGNLANVKEYYFFQPVELDDVKISLYDRSHPIDGKFPSIQVKLPDEIVDDDKLSFNISNFMREIKAHISDASKEHEYTAITKEVDWYKSAGNARKRLDEIVSVSAEFDRIVVDHIIDTTEFSERIKLYEYVTHSTKYELLQAAVKERIISLGGKKFVLMIENDVLKTFVFNDDKLEEATPKDNERVKEHMREKMKDMKFNNMLGFNAYFNKKYIVFKTRDMKQTRNSGARCDQKTKSGIEAEISELLKSAGVDETLAPHSETKKGVAKTKKIQNAKELCADLEILHRYFDMKAKNGVKWYLTAEEYMLKQQNN